MVIQRTAIFVFGFNVGFAFSSTMIVVDQFPELDPFKEMIDLFSP